MKIFYDGYIYTEQWRQKGGVSRYFDNLINNLSHDSCPIVTTTRPKKYEVLKHKNLRLYRFPFNFKPRRFSRFIQKKYFQYRFSQVQAQIFHPTYYQMLNDSFIQQVKVPTVITVYDMIHELFSDVLDPTGQIAAVKKRAIFSAQALICISESTKNDLLSLYPHLEKRTWVTYLATELSQQSLNFLSSPSEYPYFLYVGSRNYYKNFNRLLDAFSFAIKKYPEVKLYIVGSPFNKEELKRISYLNLSKQVVNFGLLNDAQLANLYKSSLALVYPSMYEGFGIPPLEAMACGSIVIASNTSSIPEVIGEAGLYFNPTSMDELLDQLLVAVENPIYCQTLRERGLKQVAKFSWEKTAQQTIEIYKNVL